MLRIERQSGGPYLFLLKDDSHKDKPGIGCWSEMEANIWQSIASSQPWLYSEKQRSMTELQNASFDAVWITIAVTGKQTIGVDRRGFVITVAGDPVNCVLQVDPATIPQTLFAGVGFDISDVGYWAFDSAGGIRYEAQYPLVQKRWTLEAAESTLSWLTLVEDLLLLKSVTNVAAELAVIQRPYKLAPVEPSYSLVEHIRTSGFRFLPVPLSGVMNMPFLLKLQEHIHSTDELSPYWKTVHNRVVEKLVKHR